MSPGPLVTRSELRKQKEAREQAERNEQQEWEEQAQNLRRDNQQAAKQASQNFNKENKAIDKFYRRESKKLKPIKKSRRTEADKSKRRNRFLNKAILIVGLLLVIVLLAVFFV
jgi:hypothetical protein